jgi:hypothetical protein
MIEFGGADASIIVQYASVRLIFDADQRTRQYL